MAKKKIPVQLKKKPRLLGKRILAWCDSPRVATGFGLVARELLTTWASEGALIDIIAINDVGGWYDPNEYPFRMYPAMPGASPQADVYGRPVLAEALLGRHTELQGPWDIVWVLTDHFILEQKLGGYFENGTAHFLRQAINGWKEQHGIDTKLALYTPVDSVMKANWVVDGILPFDKIVSYTKYGKKEMMRACPPECLEELSSKISDIPHGVSLDVFKPVSKEARDDFRARLFADWLKPHDFLMVNVNRNQPRKDLSRTLEVFKQFQQRIPDAKLYIHSAAQDVGGNLNEMARCIGLDTDLVRLPQDWDSRKPFSPEFMNLLYNAADVVISTHLGEGWGLSLTEAMAAERPVVFHNVTSIPEILGLPYQDHTDIKVLAPEDCTRGIGVATSDFVNLGVSDLERPRPIASVKDFVDKLIWVYEHESQAAAMGVEARKWLVASNMSWKSVGIRWIDEVFLDLVGKPVVK